MRPSNIFLAAIAFFLCVQTAFSEPAFSEPTKHCPCGRKHAPIGVMGDHTHPEGEWMFSYRYMNMDMDGNRDGTQRVSTADVLSSYMVAPLDMDMEMHMLGAMYAPSDALTLMLMLPYNVISMNHITRMGARFKTEAEGLGDVKLSGLYNVFQKDTSALHINLGLSFPTGDIDERDDTPAMANAKLPYPMQLGSGTYDLMPGFTFTSSEGSVTYGTQVIGTIRLGENDNDYTLGDKLEATTWLGYNINENVQSSFRVAWSSVGNIDGADGELNPMMVPTADSGLRAGKRLDLGFGIHLLLPFLNDVRVAAEYLLPVYQDLDGPQLEVDGALVLGVQATL